MMSVLEKKTAVSLALLMVFRMLGLFMILPVLAIFVNSWPNATQWTGLALGIYGLTQSMLQIPFGILSDRIGRKNIIIIGLVIFAFGSVVAALSQSMLALIIGRALQGAGAIGGVVIALLSDLTSVENRTKAMAVIGISIGLSFAVAMVLGPLLASWLGVRSIFAFTAMLAIIGIFLIVHVVPSPPFVDEKKSEKIHFFQLLIDPVLWRLNMGILIQHAILTALFVVTPIILLNTIHVGEVHQWWVYLPVLLIAYILITPFIMKAKQHQQTKIMLISIAILALSQFIFIIIGNTGIGFIVALTLFFASFTLLEALLPTMISYSAPGSKKGTAMGVYSTSQFFGIFLGGLWGGWLNHHYGQQSIFIANLILALIWVSFMMIGKHNRKAY